MAEGTPVAATDVGGTRETLAGTGSPVVRAEDISAAAFRLLEHPDRMKDISESMQDAAPRHDVRRYGEELSSILTGSAKS
jgi:glycosyltransferase involved in cell wall biosynthesis